MNYTTASDKIIYSNGITTVDQHVYTKVDKTDLIIPQMTEQEFGGLTKEQVLEACKEKFPENFV